MCVCCTPFNIVFHLFLSIVFVCFHIFLNHISQSYWNKVWMIEASSHHSKFAKKRPNSTENVTVLWWGIRISIRPVIKSVVRTSGLRHQWWQSGRFEREDLKLKTNQNTRGSMGRAVLANIMSRTWSHSHSTRRGASAQALPAEQRSSTGHHHLRQVKWLWSRTGSCSACFRCFSAPTHLNETNGFISWGADGLNAVCWSQTPRASHDFMITTFPHYFPLTLPIWIWCQLSKKNIGKNHFKH